MKRTDLGINFLLNCDLSSTNGFYLALKKGIIHIPKDSGLGVGVGICYSLV
jgi:hypothetical protein